MDFEEIYRLYFHQVFIYIRSLSSDQVLVEEISQETFFKALKALDSFDSSWIFGPGFLLMGKILTSPTIGKTSLI